jgi:hypothetical protein
MMRIQKETGVIVGDPIDQYVAFGITVWPIKNLPIFLEVPQTERAKTAPKATEYEGSLAVIDDNTSCFRDQIRDLPEINFLKRVLLLHYRLPVQGSLVRLALLPARLYAAIYEGMVKGGSRHSTAAIRPRKQTRRNRREDWSPESSNHIRRQIPYAQKPTFETIVVYHST